MIRMIYSKNVIIVNKMFLLVNSLCKDLLVLFIGSVKGMGIFKGLWLFGSQIDFSESNT